MTSENHKSKQITVNFRHLLSASRRAQQSALAPALTSKPCNLTTFFVAAETLRGTFV
jgi:hypothetical protein